MRLPPYLPDRRPTIVGAVPLGILENPPTRLPSYWTLCCMRCGISVKVLGSFVLVISTIDKLIVGRILAIQSANFVGI